MSKARCAILVSTALLCVGSPFAANQVSAAQYYNDWAAGFFIGNPSQAGTTDDPDGDRDMNLVEFAFGTDPTVPGANADKIVSKSGATSGSTGVFSLEIFERAGHRPGSQVDLWLNSDLTSTNWFRPWWLRVTTNSQPGDPVSSVRENFSTYLPGTNVWFARAAVRLIDAGVTNATYYVATNGSDSNAGTSNAPFATLSKAVGLANAGNLIYVRDGTYHFNSQISITRSGTPAQPILARAFPGEHPIFDFTAEPSTNAGINLKGNCWRIYGLEVEHAGHNGILINGSSNIVERCVVHESGDTGIHVTAATSTLASYNLVLNCDSYRNYDPPVGGNADGITAKFTVGPGNVFSGCRTWNNSDDGWDFWMATNAIIVQNCITFSNGFNVFDANPATNTQFKGDGNGFKMGGKYQPGPHHYLNCVSFGNRVNGFDQNNNTAGLTVDNCTAFDNGGQSFDLKHDSTNAPMVGVHVVRNNLSIGGTTNTFIAGSLLTNNSWQIVSPAPTAADVLSVDVSAMTGPRRDDGSLPELLFLRPVPGGRLVDKGLDTGQPFNGSAPDLGAYESPEW